MVPGVTPPEALKCDLFISFNKADVDFVDKLAKRVEEEDYNGRKLRCFHSEWDIQPGENILLRIEAAQPSSRFVGVVMSPDWLTSDWTTLERVIPVYDDPVGLKGRVIPLLRRNCDIPASIRILKWIDFRSDSNFERASKLLMARMEGESPRSWIAGAQTLHTQEQSHPMDSTTPAMQNEILATNLFPVLELPRYVHSTLSKVSRREEIWPLVGEGALLPPFAIREDAHKIYSFAPIDNPQYQFGDITTKSSTERLSVLDLIRGELRPIVIELLNRSMTAHMKNLGMVYDWNSKKTFFPLLMKTDLVRYAAWQAGDRRFERMLVVKPEKAAYYAHRQCKATFTEMGNSLYLRLIPGWHFTTDGMGNAVDSRKMSSLSSRWMNMERNHTVLDDVRFWINTLSGNKDKLMLDVGGKVSAKISATPVFSSIDYGIEGDYRERLWNEAEPDVDEAKSAVESEDFSETDDKREVGT